MEKNQTFKSLGDFARREPEAALRFPGVRDLLLRSDETSTSTAASKAGAR